MRLALHATGTATAYRGFRSRANKIDQHLGAPALIAAGSDDEHTPSPESEELYAAAANPKVLWIVKAAHHQDLLAYNTEEYKAHVVKFLITNLRTTPQFEPERLNRSEIEKLFTVQGTLENPITFVPNRDDDFFERQLRPSKLFKKLWLRAS